MKEEEEYRDVITGETYSEFKKKRVKKTITISIIVAIVVIAGLTFYIIASEKTAENSVLLKKLKTMKCTSQCIVETSQDSIRRFEPGCETKCNTRYLSNLTTKENLAITNNIAPIANLTIEYENCTSMLTNLQGSEYQNCFTDLFDRHKDITDFNDFVLYPRGV